MKKLFLSILCAISAYGISAQQFTPLDVYPNVPGSRLVYNSFDGTGNLIATLTHTIQDSYDYQGDHTTNIGFILRDANGYILNQGNITANFQGENFFLNLDGDHYVPEVVKYLSIQTMLSGNFLDYPDFFSSEFADNDVFRSMGGDISVREGGRQETTVKVYNREFVGIEEIKTPADKFDARKIVFRVDVINSDSQQETTFKGVEWYSSGNGIVRTEIRDMNGDLMNFTELTEIVLE